MSVETALRDRMACPHCRAIFRGSFARCPRDGTELDVAVDDPLVGSTLAERYIVETLLGEGAMGRVYRARHTRMSRRFAIKVLFGDCALDSKTQARFSQEAEAASRLSHRNVVGVVDFGETAEGLLYLAMDYADGPTLATVIAREGPMKPSRVLALSTQLAEGLAHAHGRGLVHRDFKPDNIIVGVDDEGVEVCRIVDFGIAVLRDDDDALIQGRLTTAGLVMGTPHYMAPEQATGDLIDERTDLFAYGLTIYEMLSGVLPFDGAPVQVARMNLAVDPPPIGERVRGLIVDPLLESLAFWLMAKRPEDRPQTSRQVVELLELIASDRTAAAAALGRRDDGPSAAAVTSATPTPVPRGATMPMAAGAVRRPSRPSSVTDVVDVSAIHPDLGNELGAGQDTDVESGASSTSARRRKAAVIVAAALGLAGLGGTLAIMLSGRGQTPAPGPVAEAPVEVAPTPAPTPTPTPTPTVDPMPTTPEAIAEAPKPTPVEPVPPTTPEAIAEAPKPTPTPRKPRPTGTTRPSGTAKPTPPPVEVKPEPPVSKPEPAAEAPTVGNLTAQYRAAGQAIEALLRDKGSAVANPLKNRYLKIPYSDALRNPALRQDVLARLAALRRDVAAAR